MNKDVILKPRVSEKAYALSDSLNTYIFDVNPGANKHAVASAVSKQYDVTVTNVRAASVRGKSVRVVRRRGRTVSGQRSNVRKVYVTLKAGDKLPIFSATDNEVKTAKEKN